MESPEYKSYRIRELHGMLYDLVFTADLDIAEKNNPEKFKQMEDAVKTLYNNLGGDI